MIINPKLLYKVVVRSPCPRFVQMTHCLKEEMATHKPFAETKKEGERPNSILCLGARRKELFTAKKMNIECKQNFCLVSSK